MKRKRLSAGEIRFRVSKNDLERIEWLLTEHQAQSVSSMLRNMIYEEWRRMQTPQRGKSA